MGTKKAPKKINRTKAEKRTPKTQKKEKKKVPGVYLGKLLGVGVGFFVLSSSVSKSHAAAALAGVPRPSELRHGSEK